MAVTAGKQQRPAGLRCSQAHSPSATAALIAGLIVPAPPLATRSAARSARVWAKQKHTGVTACTAFLPTRAATIRPVTRVPCRWNTTSQPAVGQYCQAPSAASGRWARTGAVPTTGPVCPLQVVVDTDDLGLGELDHVTNSVFLGAPSTSIVDPKLDALIDALAEIATQARADSIDADQARTNRKVLVFSYYGDTVDWILQRLHTAVASDPRLADYSGRITSVTGSEGDKTEVMFGFAPISSQAPRGRDADRFDILVSTDVLAEGVNLQQARHIINYDLPWKPMRLVQRHGRIGSPHGKVYLRCFFPAQMLDELLGLERLIQRKIAQAAKSIGVEGEIVPGSQVGEVVFTHTDAQIKAIKDGDATLFEETEEAGALSGEEFRRILANAMADPTIAEEVTHLPWVAGSGMTSDTPGFVFCARVATHPEPVYRWVPLASDGSIDIDGITGETLTALAKALPVGGKPLPVRHRTTGCTPRGRARGSL